MAIKEQPEGNPVSDHKILTPVSPRTIAEPSPQQVFQPQLSSTPTPHTPVVPEEASAQRICDWYLRTAGPDPQLEAPLMPIDPLWSALPGTVGSILGKWELRLFISVAHTNIYGSVWTHLRPSVV